ncbi:TIGR02678 family protein [Mycolicibacterium mucogenicum]|uniref:DUF2398 family protein n=1 Tax=Mycolicibacterium mucogenicum TaxID=56689 RepID=A0A4V3AVB0_MYCMU|nr:TIGR02678 family protein [Mycolicibacterium mucogenicum]TDK84593.1 DUF2398 family protein [Mycolicibacterium mucogenicum]
MHDLDKQRAFTAMLEHPVLDRRRYPQLFSLVVHNRKDVTGWFKERLNYDLVITESAARLFRRPWGDTLTAPVRYGYPEGWRRVLVLTVLAAAVAEDAEDVTTTQELSDRVRVLTLRDDINLQVYDPDKRAERALFVKAVALLAHTGVLRPTDADDEDRRAGWVGRSDAVGGAYEVDRHLLLRLVEPTSLAAALGRWGQATGAGEDGVASRHRVMRRLIELPACLYDDLTEADRAYLANQRARLAEWCREMTGWVVEQRAEGMALIASDEEDTDLPFPRMRALDFATLILLNELRSVIDEQREVGDGEVLAAAGRIRERYPKALTKELDTDQAIKEQSVQLLSALDLIRLVPTSAGQRWWLSPVAERFRDPEVVAVSSRLDSEEELEQ